MRIKSLTIKEYLKKENIQINNLPDNFQLIIDIANMPKINISTRDYKEEHKKIKEDLKNLLDKEISSIVFKNINIEECDDMDYIMQRIGECTTKISIQNSNIGNLDSYMSIISEKTGKNYTLSEKQYIKKLEYNKDNGMLVIAGENLDILSEINRYKNPNLLKIEIYSKSDLKNLVKYIDVIREMKLSKNILVDKTIEKNIDIYKYENYINERIIIFRSNLIKESIGLDRLPTKKINQTIYNLKIDGSKVNKECVYVLEGEEEDLFIKDMKDIIKYLNIANIEYKNIIFSDKIQIKKVIIEAERSILSKELVKENCEIIKRNIIDVIKEKMHKIFNMNFGINRKQKALPEYNEKTEIFI